MNALDISQDINVYLIIAACLFAIGVYGFLRRRTIIGMLISGELIFAAATLNIMAFNRFTSPDPVTGQVFTLFIMGIAAAEVAIALSIVIAVYRNYRSIHTEDLHQLKG